jgi:hypothetical protein
VVFFGGYGVCGVNMTPVIRFGQVSHKNVKVMKSMNEVKVAKPILVESMLKNWKCKPI